MTSKGLIVSKPTGLWMEPREMFAFDTMDQGDGFPGFSGKELKVVDTKTEYRLSLKTPGYDKKHLRVSVKDGMLTFCGERKEESKSKESYCSSYGSFTRSMPLPDGVNAKKAKVEVHNGEVKVTMPKNSCK